MKRSKKETPFYLYFYMYAIIQAQEAVKHGIHVTKAAVSQNFGQSYKNQLERAPFYGLQLGMSTRQWWEEVCSILFFQEYIS